MKEDSFPISSDEIRKVEMLSLRSLTPQDGLSQFFSLLPEFAPLLDESEPVYRAERIQAMITLQSRLYALDNLQQRKLNAKSY